MALTTTLGVVTAGAGTWDWMLDTAAAGTPAGTSYVYVEGTDTGGRKDQAVFRLKVGAPDDGADNGDPHVLTVDGTYYDFQAAGEFTILRDSEGLEVQARQTPVPTANPITDGHTGLTACVSVNTAVAARVGKSRVPTRPPGRWPDPEPLRRRGAEASSRTERGIDLRTPAVTSIPPATRRGCRHRLRQRTRC